MVSLEDVIEGCKNGDRTMQKELYDRYSPKFYAICRRYSFDDETAKEILTESFLSIFNGIADFRGKGSFEGWMRTILIRKAIKVYRRDKKHVQMLGNEELTSSEHTILPIEQQIDLREAITMAMRRLGNQQRQAFNLVAVEGYSFSEAAALLHVTVNVVKYHYYGAQKRLQKLLSNHLGRHYMKELEP